MAQPVPRVGVGSSRRGFTFVELIVVIVIVGILSVLAYGGWNRVMWLVQAKGSADELRNALLLARADAMARKHNSGFMVDLDNHYYKRFVDSTNGDVAKGSYLSTDFLLDSQPLPAHLVFSSAQSSISSDPPPRNCNSTAGPSVPTTHTGPTGQYSIVFHPDGRSWAAFDATFGSSTFPDDTFRLHVLPATGLVTLEH